MDNKRCQNEQCPNKKANGATDIGNEKERASELKSVSLEDVFIQVCFCITSRNGTRMRRYRYCTCLQ